MSGKQLPQGLVATFCGKLIDFLRGSPILAKRHPCTPQIHMRRQKAIIRGNSLGTRRPRRSRLGDLSGQPLGVHLLCLPVESVNPLAGVDTVDGCEIRFAPPKKPWNHDYLVQVVQDFVETTVETHCLLAFAGESSFQES